LSSIVTRLSLRSGDIYVEQEATLQEQPLQPDQPSQPQNEALEEVFPVENPWLRLADVVLTVAPVEGENVTLRWLFAGGEAIMLLWTAWAIMARVLKAICGQCCRARKRLSLDAAGASPGPAAEVDPGPGVTSLISENESVEWLNQGLKVLWPHISKAVHQELIDNVLPKLSQDMPSFGGLLKVQRFSLGEGTPRVSNFRVLRTPSGLKARATVELQAAVDIEFSATLATVGISAVQLSGDMEIALEPILDEVPLFGAVCIGFIAPPDLQLEFTGVLQVANMEVFQSVLNTLVVQKLVLPNRVIVQLAEDSQVDVAALAVPEPIAVLRVAALSARDLLAGDWHIHKKGTSDAYVKARLGSESWQSPTAPPTCHPSWDSSNDHFFLAFHDELHLSLDVYDEDKFSAHDHLGSVKPLPLRDAHQHSRRLLELFTTSETTISADKQGTACGTLRMQLENYNLTPGELGLAHSLVVIRVMRVWLPRNYGSRARIEVELNENKQTIRSGTATIVKVKKTNHDEVLKQVAERCLRAGQDASATAQLLGITQDDLGLLIAAPTDAAGRQRQIRREASRGDHADASTSAVDKQVEEDSLEQVVLGGAAHFIERMDGLGKQELRLSLSGRWGGTFGTYTVPMTKVLAEPGFCLPGPIWFSVDKAGEPKIKAHIEVSVVGLRCAN